MKHVEIMCWSLVKTKKTEFKKSKKNACRPLWPILCSIQLFSGVNTIQSSGINFCENMLTLKLEDIFPLQKEKKSRVTACSSALLHQELDLQRCSPLAIIISQPDLRGFLGKIPIYKFTKHIWVFPKIGVPPNHPF